MAQRFLAVAVLLVLVLQPLLPVGQAAVQVAVEKWRVELGGVGVCVAPRQGLATQHYALIGLCNGTALLVELGTGRVLYRAKAYPASLHEEGGVAAAVVASEGAPRLVLVDGSGVVEFKPRGLYGVLLAAVTPDGRYILVLASDGVALYERLGPGNYVYRDGTRHGGLEGQPLAWLWSDGGRRLLVLVGSSHGDLYCLAYGISGDRIVVGGPVWLPGSWVQTVYPSVRLALTGDAGRLYLARVDPDHGVCGEVVEEYSVEEGMVLDAAYNPSTGVLAVLTDKGLLYLYKPSGELAARVLTERYTFDIGWLNESLLAELVGAAEGLKLVVANVTSGLERLETVAEEILGDYGALLHGSLIIAYNETTLALYEVAANAPPATKAVEEEGGGETSTATATSAPSAGAAPTATVTKTVTRIVTVRETVTKTVATTVREVETVVSPTIVTATLATTVTVRAPVETVTVTAAVPTTYTVTATHTVVSTKTLPPTTLYSTLTVTSTATVSVGGGEGVSPEAVAASALILASSILGALVLRRRG